MVLSLTVNWFPPSYRATIVSSWQLCFEAIGYTLDETTHGENLMNSFQVRRFRVSMWWAYRHRTWCQARLKDLSKTLQSDGKQVWIEARSRCFAAFAWPLRGGGGDCDVCSTSLLLDGWMDGWTMDDWLMLIPLQWMTPVGAAWICGQAFTKRIRFKIEEVLKLRADKWEKMLDMNGSEPAKIFMRLSW